MKPIRSKNAGIFCLLLSIIPAFVFCQDKAATIRVANDSVLVDSLLTLSRKTLLSEPENSIQYSNEAIALADKIGYWNGKAVGLKNIGIVHYYQAKRLDALNFYAQSLKVYESTQNYSGMANLLSNMGVVYMESGDRKNALDHYLQSLKYAEQAGDKFRKLIILNNIGGVYESEIATQDKALDYYQQAYNLAAELNKTEEAGAISINLGNIFFKKKNDSLAQLYFTKALEWYKNSENIFFAYNGLGKIDSKKTRYDAALANHQKALRAATKVNHKVGLIQTYTEIANVYADKKEFETSTSFYKKAEQIAKETENLLELKDIYQKSAEIYANQKDFVNAYHYVTSYANIKDSISIDEINKKLGSLQFEIDLQRNKSELDLLKIDQDLKDEKLKKQQVIKYALLGGLGLMLLLAGILYRGYNTKLKTNIILDKQKVEIESLLFNILPEEVAYELRQTGAATPRYYENVSVMFTDFKGFTALADQLSPQEVIQELDENFQKFDSIIDKYNLEKIKTIGDAYMCAAGIPTPRAGDHFQIMRAAIEIRDYIEEKNRKRINNDKKPWEIRIGIHMGPLVAGVVGKRKYAYDIWGNTVNIASRMETNVEPGNIAISAKAYEMVKEKFDCDYKGKVNAKNVGDVDMYYLLEEKKNVSKLEFV